MIFNYRPGMDIVADSTEELEIFNLDIHYGYCAVLGTIWPFDGFTRLGSPIHIQNSRGITIENITAVSTLDNVQQEIPLNPTLITLCASDAASPYDAYVERVSISNITGLFTQPQFAGSDEWWQVNKWDSFGAIAIRSESSYNEPFINLITISDSEFQLSDPVYSSPANQSWESGFISFDIYYGTSEDLKVNQMNVSKCSFDGFPVVTAFNYNDEILLSSFHFVQNSMTSSTCKFQGGDIKFYDLSSPPSVLASNSFTGASPQEYYASEYTTALLLDHCCVSSYPGMVSVQNNLFTTSETSGEDFKCIVVDRGTPPYDEGVSIINNALIDTEFGILYADDYHEVSSAELCYNAWDSSITHYAQYEVVDGEPQSELLDTDLIEDHYGLMIVPENAFFDLVDFRPKEDSGMHGSGLASIINYDGSPSDRGLYGGIYAKQTLVTMPPFQFTLDQSPYFIPGPSTFVLTHDIPVDPGVHITFAEGGEVKFTPGSENQEIGDLSGLPVYFRPAREDAYDGDFALGIPTDDPVSWTGCYLDNAVTKDLELRNVEIQGAETGFYSGNWTASVSLDECRITDCVDFGVHLSKAAPADIHECTFSNNGIGLYLYDSPHSIIDANDINGSVSDGLYLQGSSFCRVDNNHITDNGRDGVSLVKSDLFKFRYNEVTSNDRNGISQVGCDVTYTQNNISANGDYPEGLGLEVHSGLADLHENKINTFVFNGSTLGQIRVADKAGFDLECGHNNIDHYLSHPFITDERPMISADYTQNYWYEQHENDIAPYLPAFADFIPFDMYENPSPNNPDCTPRGGGDGLGEFQTARDSEEVNDPVTSDSYCYLIDSYPDSPWSGHATAAVRRLSEEGELPTTRDYLFNAADASGSALVEQLAFTQAIATYAEEDITR